MNRFNTTLDLATEFSEENIEETVNGTTRKHPATPHSSTALVSFKRISKSFRVDGRTVEAIQDFSLDIIEGEFIAIVGSSGCGKSTLLRLLAGLDVDFQGYIHVEGQAIHGIGSDRGIVFQEHRLFPWLTVEQNIALGLANEKISRAERDSRVQTLIQLVGLIGFEHARPHQLSGGMAQRVAIARGLVSSPRILLLDEPFGALDALTRHQMQNELLHIRERKRITTILVTHDVEEAITLADRVVVMAPRPGRIKHVVSIPLEHPRKRSSYEFHQLREQLLHELTHINP